MTADRTTPADITSLEQKLEDFRSGLQPGERTLFDHLIVRVSSDDDDVEGHALGLPPAPSWTDIKGQIHDALAAVLEEMGKQGEYGFPTTYPL